MICPACHQNIRADCPVHNREPGSCRFPHVVPVVWKCTACNQGKPRYHKGHDPHRNNPGECRLADPLTDTQRFGAHPREPRAPTTEHPTAERSSYDQTRSDAEEHQGESASSTDNPRDVHRQRFADAATGPPNFPDWTRFDVQQSLKRLRSYDPKVVVKELRKLHLRWWHASDPTMRTILKAVGLDEPRLQLIKPIVESCRECRAWQKPGNNTVPSVSIPTKFIQEWGM